MQNDNDSLLVHVVKRQQPLCYCSASKRDKTRKGTMRCEKEEREGEEVVVNRCEHAVDLS